MQIDSSNLGFRELNQFIVDQKQPIVEVNNVLGQRYIGTNLKNKQIILRGTPGNALGSYLQETEIVLYGNGQDAIGDTMNSGKIVIHGNCGDALGYAMRGGEIYVHGDGGYRIGIHMKEYGSQKPAIVIGGKAGQFLGEYQAGGIIIVLGMGVDDGVSVVDSFCGTGMHGGAIYIRSQYMPQNLPEQVSSEQLKDNEEIREYIEEFCHLFNEDIHALMDSHYYKLMPNSNNPYHQLYTDN